MTIERLHRPATLTTFRQPKRGSHDVGEPLGGREPGEVGRFEPARLGKLLVEHRLAGKPARREGEDYEMTLDAVLGVARDHLAISGKSHRRDGKPGLFA